MIHSLRKKSMPRGFTLIEVIVVIVIAAVLAALLVVFMGTALTRSADPVIQTQNLASAEGVMERISADYMTYLNTGTPSWATFKGNSGTYPNATATSYPNWNSTNFEMLEVTVTSGDHKLVSYFME